MKNIKVKVSEIREDLMQDNYISYLLRVNPRKAKGLSWKIAFRLMDELSDKIHALACEVRLASKEKKEYEAIYDQYFIGPIYPVSKEDIRTLKAVGLIK